MSFKELYGKKSLVLEYSESFINKQVQRLKLQGGRNVTNDDIRSDIVRFDQLKTNSALQARIREIVNALQPDEGREDYIERLKKDPLDITRYQWKELTHVVHQFAPPEKKLKSNTDTVGGIGNLGAKLISDTNGLKIYFGDTKENCIIFQQFLNDQVLKQPVEMQKKLKEITGRSSNTTYNWCIGWVNNNQFDTYRYSKGKSASAFYVVDTEKPLTDPFHVIVVHSQQDDLYRVTNAFNNKEEANIEWSRVTSFWQPKLKDLKEVIAYRPFTPEEEARMFEVYGNRYQAIDASVFRTLNTYKAKEMYIAAYGRSGRLFAEDYLKLDSKLQHLYINVACHPDAADASNVSFRKTFYPFKDSSRDRIPQASEEAMAILEPLSMEQARTDVTFKEPLMRDPDILQSKSPQTIKLWRKFAGDVINEYILGDKKKRAL